MARTARATGGGKTVGTFDAFCAWLKTEFALLSAAWEIEYQGEKYVKPTFDIQPIYVSLLRCLAEPGY